MEEKTAPETEKKEEAPEETQEQEEKKAPEEEKKGEQPKEKAKERDPSHDETWLIEKGWTKKHGWAIKTETLDDSYDVIYVEDLSEIAKECDYFEHPDCGELAYELEDALDTQEDRDADAEENEKELAKSKYKKEEPAEDLINVKMNVDVAGLTPEKEPDESKCMDCGINIAGCPKIFEIKDGKIVLCDSCFKKRKKD